MQVNHFYRFNFKTKNPNPLNRISGPCPCISIDKWPKDQENKHLRHLISFDATGIDFNFKKYADSILSIFYSDRFHEDGGFVLHETQRTNINAVNKELPQELSGKYDMLNKGLPFELEQDDQYSLEQIELGLKNSDDVEWLEDDKLNISIGGFPFFFQGDETPIVEKKRAHFIMQFDLTHHEIFELMFGGDYAVFLFSDDNGNIISVGQQ